MLLARVILPPLVVQGRKERSLSCRAPSKPKTGESDAGVRVWRGGIGNDSRFCCCWGGFAPCSSGLLARFFAPSLPVERLKEKPSNGAPPTTPDIGESGDIDIRCFCWGWYFWSATSAAISDVFSPEFSSLIRPLIWRSLAACISVAKSDWGTLISPLKQRMKFQPLRGN